MKKNLKKRNGGFTLVEVIVVLVILAILATIMIPSLTGYIDKANDRAIIAETRSCVMAAQTLASEDYGLKLTGENKTCTPDNIKKLAEVSGSIESCVVTDGKVASLVYKNTKTCTYNGTTYTVKAS